MLFTLILYFLFLLLSRITFFLCFLCCVFYSLYLIASLIFKHGLTNNKIMYIVLARLKKNKQNYILLQNIDEYVLPIAAFKHS